MSAGQAQATAPTIDQLVDAELLRSSLSNQTRATRNMLLFLGICGLFLFLELPAWRVIAWYAFFALVVVARIPFVHALERAAFDPRDMSGWRLVVELNSFALGLAWGSAGFLLYEPGNVPVNLFVLLVVTRTVVVSAIAVSYSQRVYYLYAVPTMAPITLSLILEGIPLTLTLAALSIWLLYANTGFAGHFRQTVRESLRLRFEREQMAEELRRQRDAADEANRGKSRFLAAASHDLRQPLHALGLFLQSLRESALPAAERDLVANAGSSAEAMEHMFNALLDVSQLDAGIIEPDARTFPLQGLFARLHSAWEGPAREKGLELKIAPTRAYVHSDPVLLERILANFLANAVRYAASGTILLAARRGGQGVRVEVRDAGPGIPLDRQAEIYEEFVQVGNPERDRRKGLGLGLAIVRRLASLLGHPIGLRSAPGRGSVFSVALPRGRPEEYAPTPERATGDARGADLAGALVALVDDEEEVRKAMSGLLERWGCTVVAAGSGAEAIERLSVLPRAPDLLICDYRLRDNENGIEAIAALRDEFNAELPALLITGDTAPERLHEAHASGLPVLHKPLNPARLRARIGSLLKRPP